MSPQDYVGKRFVPSIRLMFHNTQSAEPDKPFTFTQSLCDEGFDPQGWLNAGIAVLAPEGPTTTPTGSASPSAGDADDAPRAGAQAKGAAAPKA